MHFHPVGKILFPGLPDDRQDPLHAIERWRAGLDIRAPGVFARDPGRDAGRARHVFAKQLDQADHCLMKQGVGRPGDVPARSPARARAVDDLLELEPRPGYEHPGLAGGVVVSHGRSPGIYSKDDHEGGTTGAFLGAIVGALPGRTRIDTGGDEGSTAVSVPAKGASASLSSTTQPCSHSLLKNWAIAILTRTRFLSSDLRPTFLLW